MNNTIIPQSDSEWQVFKFGDIEVLAKLNEQGEPLILAAPICKALSLDDVSKAVARLDNDEKGVTISILNGVPVRHLAITEAGLYSLVLGSRKAEAKALKRFVTHEVLPAIRKTGSYSVSQKPPDQLDIVEGMVKALRAYSNRLTTLEAKVDDADYLTIDQFCRRQGIKASIATTSIKQAWGRRATELSIERGVEKKKAFEGKREVGRYHISILLDICRPIEKKLGQLSFLDED